MTPSRDEPAARWKPLADGGRVLRLWETIGPEWPQIALLDISNELYNELQHNPKMFADKYKIFPKAVQPVERCTELDAPPKDYSGRWSVILYHRTASAMRCGSFPVEDSR